MARMVLDTKFLLDNAGQDGRGPNSGLQTVSHRTAFNDVVELLALRRVQFTGPCAAIAFLDPLLALFIPAAHPGVDARAVNLKPVGDLRRRVAIDSEQNGLQAWHHSWSPVGLSLLAQG